MELKISEKLNINEILKDLDKYRPRRRGWSIRKAASNLKLGPFVYKNMSKSLKNSIGLPSSKYFNSIDPQPQPVITTEIASGRFEDDIRRMRMAAWHGADHIMVIRTAGQSHFDGLIEGTPQGVGGIPVSRKQVRAQRKALDLIEDEVGRLLNYHSYVSGVAGPDIAVMFAEEGVNGVHQDPQYNILYRGINMIRSFVDAAEAKKIIAWADMAQIDGAHNANATAREAWKVMPELMVQHAINSAFSTKCGIKPENIYLSTVPPTAPPAPAMRIDLPYAVALREFFSDYKMRAQQNTKYIEADLREASVTHSLNTIISLLTSADIQSTITPDEGRNIPWHYNSIAGIATAKQTWAGCDGIKEILAIKREGELGEKVRELKERAVLYMEEILETGGYFKAVEEGFFVDSAEYPERHGDGIVRKINGGIGEGTVYKRDSDYLAPVTAHFGENHLPEGITNPADLINGSTFEDPEKIVFIDELDENDNVNQRLKESSQFLSLEHLKPEVQWAGDGVILLTMMLPCDSRHAEAAAIEIGKKMNLIDVEVIRKEIMHPAEGTLIEMKGVLTFDIDATKLTLAPIPEVMSDEDIRSQIKKNPLTVVAGTIGQDEHSVGLREIIDIKHGGIEKYGIMPIYLGTSVVPEKIVDAAIEANAAAILASTIISHNNIHYKNMKKIHELCIEKGVRDKIILIAGGTQVKDKEAKDAGMDKGFGRGTKGIHVVSFIIKQRQKIKKQE